jgi:Ig-like domain from next to BRCA1 gene
MKRLITLTIPLILFTLASACGSHPPSQTPAGTITSDLPNLPDCDRAELVSETIPPGTSFIAGEKFDKTWVIKNASTCNWDYQYYLVYYSGTGMGETTSRVFTENRAPETVIPPGETATITLNLQAPFSPGRQVGYWKLRDPAGMLFMPFNVNQDQFSVDIEVVGTVYSFVDNYCQAAWRLDSQSIQCPESKDNAKYAIGVEYFPSFEGGSVDNEPAISILLPAEKNSTMTATYPAMIIRPGDHLHLTTACANGAPQCDLTFKVIALTEGTRKVLCEWHEISDGIMHPLDLELNDLADKSVQFVFSLSSNGAIEGNRGLWFFPVLLPY